jgi:hypothetical protein
MKLGVHTKVFLQEDLRLRTEEFRRWIDYRLIAGTAMSVRADSACETFPTRGKVRCNKKAEAKSFGLVSLT